MSYINVATKEYPLSADEVKASFPNTSFPDSANAFELAIQREGYERVHNTPEPVVDHTKNIVEGPPKLHNGVWERVWITSDATPQEIAERVANQLNVVRQERNQKLLDCDWTQLPDSPVDKATWATYRQELRDITKQADPFNIVWPVIPTTMEDDQ